MCSSDLGQQGTQLADGQQQLFDLARATDIVGRAATRGDRVSVLGFMITRRQTRVIPSNAARPGGYVAYASELQRLAVDKVWIDAGGTPEVFWSQTDPYQRAGAVVFNQRNLINPHICNLMTEKSTRSRGGLPQCAADNATFALLNPANDVHTDRDSDRKSTRLNSSH